MIVRKTQFDDILRNFINETNKYEGRFGKIRDDEKTLAVKRLVPESLLNYRFRGTTLPHEELLIALENIIVDKVTSHSISNTSAPMEIGMAKGTEKLLNLQCKQCTREQEAKVDGTRKRSQLECTEVFQQRQRRKRNDSCWKGTVARKGRDGTVIKLDVNSGVYTMDMWVCLDEWLVRFSAGKDREWLECPKQICKTKDQVQQWE